MSGFHEGELAVQARAGVGGDAVRLAGMLATPDLSGGIGGFFASRTFAVLTARDGAGRLWASPVTGAPGFLDVTGPTTLRIHGVPAPGDPLHELAAGGQLGLVVVEFARRRRARLNGMVTEADATGLTVEAEQAYGNCPKYIHPRLVEPAPGEPQEPRRGEEMSTSDIELVTGADTFFLGTTHPERGNDASHRGGPPGFVRVAGPCSLWWPDYPGNNLFNSMGNIAVDPAAALLFADFATGRTLHLSGTAALAWPGPVDELATGRRVEFTVAEVVSGEVLRPREPLRAGEDAP